MTSSKMFKIFLVVVSLETWFFKKICFASSNKGLEAFFALSVISTTTSFKLSLTVLNIF